MFLVRLYPWDFELSVKENMLATGFSNVSNETLGVYPGTGVDGEGVGSWLEYADELPV